MVSANIATITRHVARGVSLGPGVVLAGIRGFFLSTVVNRCRASRSGRFIIFDGFAWRQCSQAYAYRSCKPTVCGTAAQTPPRYVENLGRVGHTGSPWIP